MQQIEAIQKSNGFIPAYPDVRWTCSTGIFQYAVIWYKLGNTKCGDKAFNYACSLQNNSGGFFGSYGLSAQYFPNEEIGWAIKYFLDAFGWKIRASFEKTAHLFPDSIDKNDGRYRLLLSTAIDIEPEKILDIGCGKGRFLKALSEDLPLSAPHGIDISNVLLKNIPAHIQANQGNILNIPYCDESFDFAFCIEALEHAVNIPNAIKEMGRIISPNGSLLIIDKNNQRKGELKTNDWEQWFDTNELKLMLEQEGFSVTVYENIPYDQNDGSDNLFVGWLAQKK